MNLARFARETLILYHSHKDVVIGRTACIRSEAYPQEFQHH